MAGRILRHRFVCHDVAVLVIVLLLPLAYALGTFPSALMIARSRGIDIMESGSGNPGATNVSRMLGRRFGILVFVLDGLKGAISAVVGYLVAGHGGGYALVAAAVLGHVFPVTRRFKGGKGVATAGGGMIALYPLIGAVMAVLWFVVMKISKKSSLGSLAIAIGFPTALTIAGRPLSELLSGLGLCAFMVWRHWPNVQRLVRGTELSVTGNN